MKADFQNDDVHLGS